MDKGTVWIIEDDKALGSLLRDEVQDAGFSTCWTTTAEKALSKSNIRWPDLIICDLMLPGMDGLTFFHKVKNEAPSPQPAYLVITAFGTVQRAVEALKAGVDEFLTKPLDLEHFILTVKRLLKQKQLRETVDKMYGLINADAFHGMYGQSKTMRLLFNQIRQVSKARGPVLILGESGSGKELVARAIHHESQRAEHPFIPVNCAGIPEHLLESEFFGHTAGSFTGAQNRQGIFYEAQNGTLLLDEISEMPFTLQAKLLRILQDGKIRKIGENREQQVNTRILAATHSDIFRQVKSGHFREDLFFRLETFTIKVPPLRERGDDIELLAVRFARQFALVQNKAIKGLSSKALDLINNYPFPGNVRELRNAIERAVTFAKSDQIKADDLPTRMRHSTASEDDQISEHSSSVLPRTEEPLYTLEEMENRYIKHVLERLDGNKRKAAAILGIGRRTLYRKIETELYRNE